MPLSIRVLTLALLAVMVGVAVAPPADAKPPIRRLKGLTANLRMAAGNTLTLGDILPLDDADHYLVLLPKDPRTWDQDFLGELAAYAVEEEWPITAIYPEGTARNPPANFEWVYGTEMPLGYLEPKGFHSLPEVEDEVLVVFIHGDSQSGERTIVGGFKSMSEID